VKGRNERIREMREKGATLSEIAQTFGLSKARIAQLVAEPTHRYYSRKRDRVRYSEPDGPETFYVRERFG
jgi:transcriptional regulator with XRE-family HTH domain